MKTDLGIAGVSCNGQESDSPQQLVRDHQEGGGNYDERNQDIIS